MAYGKKNKIKMNWSDYNVGLLGESGAGKTTIINEICLKTLGEDGYLFAECGHEDGADAIAGIPYINCPSWSEEYDELNNSVGFIDLVDDIIENKDEEYPELKILVIDTYDELRNIVKPEVIRMYNKETDKKITSIKSAYGGYNAGEDKVDEIILDKLWELKKVGVNFIIIGHTKLKEIVNPENGETFMKLTSDMSPSTFGKIKNKLHFLGVLYIDRSFKTVRVKDKAKKFATDEKRRISFRDDDYSVDSKSRFADIIDEIPFDPDAFIKAMNDAIEAEAKKGKTSIEDLKKEQEETAEKKAKAATEYSKNQKVNKVDVEANEDIVVEIKSLFDDATAEQKKSVKEIMAENGLKNFKDVSDVPTRVLQSILDALKA